jgi:hypothetical protein
MVKQMWADPNLNDFYGRVARIEKAHKKGYGFEARGTLGRSSSYKREKASWRLVKPLVLVMAMGLGLKGVIHYYVGAELYDERVATLLAGEGFDPVGLDVTAAQADIVQLAIRELVQGLAGDARIVPGGKRRDDVRQRVDGTVGGDGAQRRLAGRLDSGHGVHPCSHSAQSKGLFPCPLPDSLAAGAKQGKEKHCRHAGAAWRVAKFCQILQGVLAAIPGPRAFLTCPSHSASAKCAGVCGRALRKPLADVPFSC